MRKVLLSFLAALLPLLASAQMPEGAVLLPDNTAETWPEDSLIDAVTLIETEEYDAALVILDSLCTAKPDFDGAHYYRGLCRFALRNIDGGLESLRRAVQLDSTNNWYLETLANACAQCGRSAEAGKIYLDLSRKQPTKFRNAYTLTLMADAYRTDRDYPLFFRTLDSFIRENVPSEAKFEFVMSALSNFDSRTFQNILPHIDTLTRHYAALEPTNASVRDLRMEICAMQENWPEVISECEALLPLVSDDKEKLLHYMSIIGDTYYNIGEKKKAFKTYDKALKVDPQYCPTLNNYAWYLSTEVGRLAKAAKMSKITVEKEPDNPTYLDTYGWILHLQGKDAEAKPYFKHAMLYGGKQSATVLLHYARVLEKLGEAELATYYRNLATQKNEGQ